MHETWYVAGPMSGIAEQNYPAFEAACVRLRAMGFDVISPHESLPNPTQPDQERYHTILRHDLSVLLTCKGIVLLPGWSTSKGARLELSLAVTLGMPVRFLKDGLLFDFS